MHVRGRSGPGQRRAVSDAPVRTGCPARYLGHVPSSHDALAFRSERMARLRPGGPGRLMTGSVLRKRMGRSGHATGQRDGTLFGPLALRDRPKPVLARVAAPGRTGRDRARLPCRPDRPAGSGRPPATGCARPDGSGPVVPLRPHRSAGKRSSPDRPRSCQPRSWLAPLIGEVPQHPMWHIAMPRAGAIHFIYGGRWLGVACL